MLGTKQVSGITTFETAKYATHTDLKAGSLEYVTETVLVLQTDRIQQIALLPNFSNSQGYLKQNKLAIDERRCPLLSSPSFSR